MDTLVEKYGLVTAAVFGRIWRYSQQGREVCDASQQKIADDLGLDRVTVNLHIKRLVDDGYLEDLTPDVKNRPHRYEVTDKAAIEITVGVVENNSTVVENNTSVVENNSTVVQNNSKIVVKKETKKPTAAKVPRARDEMFDAVLEVCKADQKLNGGRVGQVATELKAAGYTPADVRAFGADWWSWKERTKAPSVWKLKDGISQIRDNRSNGHKAPGPRLPDGI
jgi:DNA-binding Lrp family transcriptional regulator